MVSTTWISNNKFCCAITCSPKCAFKQVSDELSDARCEGDIDKAYELQAKTMKLFGNRAYGKTVTNKEKLNPTTYCNEDIIYKI